MKRQIKINKIFMISLQTEHWQVHRLTCTWINKMMTSPLSLFNLTSIRMLKQICLTKSLQGHRLIISSIAPSIKSTVISNYTVININQALRRGNNYFGKLIMPQTVNTELTKTWTIQMPNIMPIMQTHRQWGHPNRLYVCLHSTQTAFNN